MYRTEDQSPQNLRAKEASKYLGVCNATLWNYAKVGKITPIKLSPRVTIFQKSDLDDFIKTQREVS